VEQEEEDDDGEKEDDDNKEEQAEEEKTTQAGRTTKTAPTTTPRQRRPRTAHRLRGATIARPIPDLKAARVQITSGSLGITQSLPTTPRLSFFFLPVEEEEEGVFDHVPAAEVSSGCGGWGVVG
jgi:hypothetical protein